MRDGWTRWFPGRRVLITGGAGFLGSHLCDRLIALGASVVCVDNFLTGTPDNVAHLLGLPQFQFVQYDVCDFLHTSGPLDAVVHLASPASPKDYLELPIQTLRVGALGTYNALTLAQRKEARFLLASTSEVYGDPLVNPQPETYWGNVNPISPRGVYDEAKRFAEAMTMAYHRYHGLDTRIVRIFNTFGPRMRLDDGRVVSAFLTQALTGHPLTVYGDGTQTRSFCYVDDMIAGLAAVLAADSDRTIEERTDRRFLYRDNGEATPSIHEPINLGNPHEISVLEMTRMVLALTGSDSAIHFQPLPVDDPKVRRPDVRRAAALLGWEPRTSIIDGLRATAEDIRRRLQQPDVVATNAATAMGQSP